MKETLLVDGYNIIFSWPELDKARKVSLEHARSRLVDMLVNYAAMSGEFVVLVFDAHLVKKSPEHCEIVGDNIEIIFTREGETADSVIERLVGDLFGKGKTYVATSDWAEQSMIFGRGAYRITPRELLDKIKRLREEGKQHYNQSLPGESIVENRLLEGVKKTLESWRRKK